MKNLFLILSLLAISCAQNSKDVSAQYDPVSELVTSNPELGNSMERGATIYYEFCLQCHGAEGNGQAGVFPPLAKSDWLNDNLEESIRAVKFGQSGEIVVNGITYNGVMTSMGLSDEEVADVMNYITNSWGNSRDEIITVEQVIEIGK